MEDQMSVEEWYMTVRRDNGYPITVYADKERAQMIADKNGLNVVAVQPVTRTRKAMAKRRRR